MKIIYNCSNINEFEIENFEVGEPILIKKARLLLTRHRIYNVVYFFNKLLETSDQQRWVLEKSEFGDTFFYIRSYEELEGGPKYLGSPNANNIVYLYTSKNAYTLWSVKKLPRENMYEILYSGEKYDITKHTIVVARYNECLNWLLPYEDCVIVYNKGDDEIPPFKNIIRVDNIGREGHTYLFHICNNYFNLAERITFIQGDPLTHNATIIYGLDNPDKFLSFQPLGLRWLESRQIPPDKIVKKYSKKTAYGLEYLVMKLNGDLNYKDGHYFYDEGIDFLIKKYKKDYRMNSKQLISQNFLDKCKFPYNIMNKPLHDLNFTFSALFSVARQNIIIYDLNTYKSIIKELTAVHPQGGANGYILERLWMYLLDNF